ncbi:MAG: hypothetical protein RL149_415 [Actinomycetota bacterium]
MTATRHLRRWFGWLALVVVFSIACGFLSNWQFNRRQEALSAMQLLDKNYSSEPVALTELASPDSYSQENDWRNVILEGHYLATNSLLVRNRPLDGQPGFLQVVPFQLNSGEIVAVERGWLSADESYNAPAQVPLPSEEPQIVFGHVRASEPTFGRSAPSGQLPTINIDLLAKAVGVKDRYFSKLYVRMSSESIAVSQSPKQLGKPQLDEGNHLSYALQWILFALMAAAALFWGIKKEREALGLAVPKKVRTRKTTAQSDAEFEDRQLGN